MIIALTYRRNESKSTGLFSTEAVSTDEPVLVNADHIIKIRPNREGAGSVLYLTPYKMIAGGDYSHSESHEMYVLEDIRKITELLLERVQMVE